MGWCHEFGVEIEARCGHPMTAGESACSCSECGAVCDGRFEGGCEAVWQRGPRLDAPPRPSAHLPRAVFAAPPRSEAPNSVNGLNGASAQGTGQETGQGTASDLGHHLAQRLAHLENMLRRLAEQVARQSERQATLERHLTELGQVVAQHGTEVDDQLVLFEMLLDDLSARAALGEAVTVTPPDEGFPAEPLPFPPLSAVPAATEPGDDDHPLSAALDDEQRVHQLP